METQKEFYCIPRIVVLDAESDAFICASDIDFEEDYD